MKMGTLEFEERLLVAEKLPALYEPITLDLAFLRSELGSSYILPYQPYSWLWVKNNNVDRYQIKLDTYFVPTLLP